jgi:hypothetical protein
MKAALFYRNIQSKIVENLYKMYEMGMEDIGLFRHVINPNNDVEIYAVYNPANQNANYSAFKDLTEKLFPGYKVAVFTEDDIDMLGPSVVNGIMFL